MTAKLKKGDIVKIKDIRLSEYNAISNENLRETIEIYFGDEAVVVVDQIENLVRIAFFDEVILIDIKFIEKVEDNEKSK